MRKPVCIGLGSLVETPRLAAKETCDGRGRSVKRTLSASLPSAT